jgi:hypothetical protein
MLVPSGVDYLAERLTLCLLWGKFPTFKIHYVCVYYCHYLFYLFYLCFALCTRGFGKASHPAFVLNRGVLSLSQLDEIFGNWSPVIKEIFPI